MKAILRKAEKTQDYTLLYDDVIRLLEKLWSGLYAGLYYDDPEKQLVIKVYMKAWREKHPEAEISEIVEALEEAYYYALYDKYKDKCPIIIWEEGRVLICNKS